MRIRPYSEGGDYEYLEKWDSDERTHALWCANLIPWPMTKDSLRSLLERNAKEWMDNAYVATQEDGEPLGFFCYSFNVENKEGFLKFIIVDEGKRCCGYGREMLELALQFAFENTGAETVQLNVFAENEIARRCYEKVGFAVQSMEEDVFAYRNERWSRCRMKVCRDKRE